jgi:hypothetical protein
MLWHVPTINEAFMSDQKEVGELKVKVGILETKLLAIEEKVKTFVTTDQFIPTKILVYGFVGLTLTLVFGALVAKVIMK